MAAALGLIALEDFTSKMPNSNYRTTLFKQPLIKVTSPDLQDIPRQFVVWGLFLSAFYVHRAEVCHMGFFSLQWKGKRVAGVGITSPTNKDTVEASQSNDAVQVHLAFFGGPQEFGKGTVFMTIMESLMETAPQGIDDIIYKTLINYLNNEPVAVIVTPTKEARDPKGPFFTNRMLVDMLVKATDFYAGNNVYRQLEVNVTVDGVLVAQGAFAHRKNLGSLGFLDITEVQKQELSIF
ncbi:MAG: hypothetical protein Q9221_009031 [Calogaya cf. arnoldii]